FRHLGCRSPPGGDADVAGCRVHRGWCRPVRRAGCGVREVRVRCSYVLLRCGGVFMGTEVGGAATSNAVNLVDALALEAFDVIARPALATFRITQSSPEVPTLLAEVHAGCSARHDAFREYGTAAGRGEHDDADRELLGARTIVVARLQRAQDRDGDHD